MQTYWQPGAGQHQHPSIALIALPGAVPGAVPGASSISSSSSSSNRARGQWGMPATLRRRSSGDDDAAMSPDVVYQISLFLYMYVVLVSL